MQRNDEGIVNKVFSETGDAASPAFYDQGFTPAMSTPGSGVFPPRTAFNYLFKTLTALAVDVNSSGCMLAWDALVNYVQGARVIGSNNKVYIALTNNGPAEGNASNPTSSPSIWQISPENALGTMATQNANAIAVLGGAMDGVTIGENTPAPGKFTTAADGGAAPTSPSQLTNKAYVDGASVFSSTGYTKHPSGYIEQWATITIPLSQLTKSASIPNLDYWTIAPPEYVEFNYPIPFPNQLLGCHAYVLQSPFSGSNLGPNAYSEGGATTTQTKVLFVESVATGVTPNRDLIISIKVWGN